MPTVVNTKSGERREVPVSAAEKLVNSGEWKFVGEQSIIVNGEAQGVSDDFASDLAVNRGAKFETGAQADARAEERRLQAEYGDGVGNTGLAFLEALGRGASFGLSDYALEGLGVEGIKERREYNDIVAPLGEITGAIAPAFFTGGTGALGTAARLTPAGMASRGAQVLGARAAGAVGSGMRAAAIGAAVEGAAEGTLYASGQLVSAALLGDDPLTVEKVATTLGSAAVFGGGVGGLLGAGHYAAKRALGMDSVSTAFSSHLAEVDEALANGAKNRTAYLQRPDIMRQAGELVEQRPADFSALSGAQPRGKLRTNRVTDHLDEIGAGPAEAPASGEAGPNGTKNIRPEPGVNDTAQLVSKDKYAKLKAARAAQLDDAKQKIYGAAREEVAARPLDEGSIPTSEGPKRQWFSPAGDAIDAVAAPFDTAAVQFTAARAQLQKALGGKLQKLDFDHLARMKPARFKKVLEAFNGYTEAAMHLDGVAGLGMVGRIADEKALVAGLMGKVDTAGKASIEKINALDVAAIADIVGLDVEEIPVVGPAASMLLKAYAAVRLAKAAGPLGGVVEKAVRYSSNPVLNRAAQALLGNPARRISGAIGGAGLVAEKIGAAAKKFAAKAAKQVTKPGVRRAATATAVKALAKAQFGPREKGEPGMARMAELRKAMSDPMGTKTKIDASLQPVFGMNAQLGFNLADFYMKKLEYLASKMPNTTIQSLTRSNVLPPSAAALSAWANHVRAAEDPLTILDDLNDGYVTVEAVETVSTLYPELYSSIQEALLDQITETRHELPFNDRYQLSVLFQVPLEPTAAPEFVFALQSMHMAVKERQPVQGGPAPAVPKLPVEPTAGQRMTDR